jgi:hypothetical protein
VQQTGQRDTRQIVFRDFVAIAFFPRPQGAAIVGDK